MRHNIRLSQLHGKSLAILNMIIEIEHRIIRGRRLLRQWDRAKWDEPIRLMNQSRATIEDRLEWDSKIHHRLIQYYKGTVSCISFFTSKAAEVVNEF